MLSNVGAIDFREEQNASTVFKAWSGVKFVEATTLGCIHTL